MKKMIFLLGLFMFLVSCKPGPTSIAEQEVVIPTPALMPTDIVDINQPQCLLPIRDFEYPIGDVSFAWPEPEDQLPPPEWQKAVNVPDAAQLMSVQVHGDETVFWIDTKHDGFIRYRVSGNEWGDGTILTGPARGNYDYFLDRENNVWAARFSKLDNGDKTTEPLLSRYDEQTNQWEPVTFDLENQYALGIQNIEVDVRGIFWFLAMDKGKYQLYSLDPVTMAAKRHLADYVVYSPFVISHDTMFILAGNLENDPILKYMLITYSLDTEMVKTYKVPSQFYGYGGRYESEMLPNNLFVDSQHRVWLGARGWIDLSSSDTYEWHFAIPNPVFVDIQMGSGLWGWNEPKITYETPDGLLWYNSLRGTGWVDPQAGKWCVFTSYSSDVLADGQGKLWILANGWLYRHK